MGTIHNTGAIQDTGATADKQHCKDKPTRSKKTENLPPSKQKRNNRHLQDFLKAKKTVAADEGSNTEISQPSISEEHKAAPSNVDTLDVDMELKLKLIN